MDNETGKMMNYRQLLKNDKTWQIWSIGMCIELGWLSKDYKNHTKGTNTILFMTHDEI